MSRSAPEPKSIRSSLAMSHKVITDGDETRGGRAYEAPDCLIRLLDHMRVLVVPPAEVREANQSPGYLRRCPAQATVEWPH